MKEQDFFVPLVTAVGILIIALIVISIVAATKINDKKIKIDKLKEEIISLELDNVALEEKSSSKDEQMSSFKEDNDTLYMILDDKAKLMQFATDIIFAQSEYINILQIILDDQGIEYPEINYFDIRRVDNDGWLQEFNYGDWYRRKYKEGEIK